MSTIYRDRDRDRFDDSRTTISSAGRRDRDGGYTTVKRYVVKDDDSRSSYGRSDRRSFVPDRPGERVEETRIIRREREVDEPVREKERDVRRDEPRYSAEQLVIRRDTRDDDRRSSYYEPRREERTDEREEIVIRRTKEVDEPRRDDLTVARVDDRRESTQIVRREYRDDFDLPRAEDRDLTKYSRQTDYYAPAPPPQTIIIRQEPIIIRERVRDDDYVSVRRSDVEEEKSIVRRARTPDPPRQAEEDYFYEKKVRERIDDPRDRDRDREEEEWRERRVMRREVSPHDSVSQVGRHKSRRGSYSSDDSMVYVKRTKEEYSDDGGSPHNKKNLAAGVIAGIGAAELLRNHKKKEGRETSHGVGRIGRDVGAGAIGAIAAEGISRARSRYRSKSRRRSSRDRSDSGSRSRRSRSRSRRRRSRTRSESRSKLKTWGAVGLGAAALAAAAAVAQKKMAAKKEESPNGRGRSHSRGRNESVAEIANDPNAPSDDARNPRHRNIRMAEAGAAGAAITALIDHARSKSQGGRDRSRSRVRQALPVVAAGLGSAALAGLYEKNKAKKEAEDIAKTAKTDRRERRASRSRSRQRSEYSDYPRENYGNPMIEYGDGPMQGRNYGQEYYPGAGVDQYGRPPNQEGYYANQTAVIPAVAGAAAGYAAAPAAREMSDDRRSRSRSLSSSPGGHRRRHRHSRSRSGTREAAAAGGIGAAAMAEHERKERKRERRARRQQEQHGDPYEDTFNPGYPAPTPPVVDPYAANNQPGYYPQSSQFPPPPGTVPQYAGQPAPVGAHPSDFPPPPPGAPPVPGYEPYASGANPYAPPRRGADENVSVPPDPTFPSDRSVPPDGVSTPRPYPVTTPSINIHPPSVSTPSNPNATLDTADPGSYIPPTERAPSPTRSRAVSQPPPTGPRKSVQFAEKPDVQPAPESEASSPEKQRHRHRRERGYEAGDDTDSTPDDQRRRQRERGAETSRSLDPETMEGDDGRRRRHHHRRRSYEPSSAASSSKVPDRNNTASPAESDATVDLPLRFDSKGNKKSEPGEDPLADRIDEILNGKGATGKLFGNFVNGIFGPEGRKRGGSGSLGR